MTTEIASAVYIVPLGDLTLVLPSSVCPSRSSRKTVTTRRISSQAGRLGRQLQGAAELLDALADDLDLLVGRRRQRQDDGVEPPPQRRRELVDPLVAVVRRGDRR